MEVKPGYKQTGVGFIPVEWDVRTVRQASDTVTVGFVGSMAHLFTANGIPLLRGQNVLPGRIDLTDSKFISPQTHSLWQKSALLGGDIVIVRVGYPGTSSVVPHNFGAANAASLIVVRPDSACVNSDFMCFVLLSEIGRRQVKAALVGGAQQVINIGTAASLLLPVPELSEQHAIATALNDIVELLGGIEQIITKKRDLKLAAMQQLLTGQTRLPGFHGEWEVKTFGEIFNFSGGYSTSRDQLSLEGTCYLHYGDIHGATKTTVDVRADYQNIPKLDVPLNRVASKSLLEDGDVVFVDASEDNEGTSRHVVVVNKDKNPFISGLHTIVAKSKTDELAHEYRRYCFQTAAIRQQFLFYAVGTKVSGISKTNIAKLTLPLPSVPEQTAIAEVLMDMDADLAALEQRREKTRALKQAMMQELLTGRTRLVGPQGVTA